MPERTVSTLLKLDGEQQYKAAIQNINREQQTLKASIKLVDEQFRGQANTMAALTERSKLLGSQQALLSQRLSLAKDMYSRATEAASRYSIQVDAIKAKIIAEGDAEGKLAKQLQTAQENLQKAQNSTEYYKGAVTKAETEVAKINNQIKDNSKYLDEARKSATGTATSIDEYGKKTAQATKESENLGEAGKEAFDSLAQALISAGLIRGVSELVDLFKQAAAASIEWESAFAGVEKTVEGTPEQLAQINDQLLTMSTEIPLTTTELAKIAEAAGQLGIKTEDVSRFTEVMAALGVSTNLTAEQAATQLARFAKITGMTADEYDNIGSVIVALGNNSAATESEIVDMAMGIAAAGKLVGMTTPEIMAFAASLTSSGLEAQAGGTAISRTLAEISVAANGNIKDLEKYAEVAGMTAEQFANTFKSDATAAFTAFIDGLASSGDKAISVLNDMGISEIRQRDALLRLSASHGDLASAIALSTNAYAENTALTEEATKRYETTESKIQLLKNATNLLGITIGNQLSPKIREAIQAGTDIVSAIDEFIQQNPWAVQAVTGLAAAISTMTIALAGASVAFNIIIPALKSFKEAIGAASISSVLGGIAIAGLVVGLIAAAAASNKTTSEFKEQSEASKEITDRINENKKAYTESLESIESQRRGTNALVDELSALSKGYSGSNAEQERMQAIVDQLNSQIEGLSLTFDQNTGSLSLNADAIRDRAKAQFDAAEQDAKTQRYTQLLMDQADAQYAERTARKAFLAAGDKATPGELLTLNRNWRETRETLDDVNDEVDYYRDSITDATDATREASDAVESGNDIYETAVEKVQELADKYEAIKTKVADAAEKVGQFGEKLDATGKKNIDYYIKGEKSQTDFWDSYAENLQKAQEMGLDEGLLANLATPTEANAQILDSIVSGSLEKVQELNEAFQANAEARQQYVDQAAQAQAEAAGLTAQFIAEMNEFVAGMDQKDGAYMNGVDTMDGLLTGLESKLPDLYAFINGVLAELAKLSGLTIDFPGSGTGSGGFNPWKPFRVPAANGLDYVPYDEFPANLHEGESVLTKQEATAWRAMKRAAQAATPSASDMVAMSRPITARDVGAEVTRAFGSVASNRSVVFNQYNTSPVPLDEYEIGRLARQAARKIT